MRRSPTRGETRPRGKWRRSCQICDHGDKRFMDTKGIVTLTIAAYGALLSTYNAIRQRQEKKTSIVVTPSTGFLVTGLGGSRDMSVMLTVANPGHKAVTIQTPGFFLPDKRVLTFLKPLSDVNVPHKLEPEASCVVYTDARMMALQLAK